MKYWVIAYEWYNAPNWLEGSIRLPDYGGEQSLLAPAFARGLSQDKRFRKVKLLLEGTTQQAVDF